MSIHNQLSRLEAIMAAEASAELMNEVEGICESEHACKLFWCERVTRGDWFSMMIQRNWFTNPPAVRKEGDIIVHPSWPESIVLLNFAATLPGDVANVLATIPLTDNPRVGDQIIRIAAVFRDPIHMGVVRDRISKIISDHARSARLWLLDLLGGWLAAGAADQVLRILPSVLTFNVEKEAGSSSTDSWELSQIDEQVLAAIASSHPRELLSILCEALETLFEGEASNETLATLWLEDFSVNPGFSHQRETVLILRVYATCRLLIEKERQTGARWVDELLRRRRGVLFRRLCWQLYADFPPLFLDEARRDVLDRIPYMASLPHGYELQKMISAFVAQDGTRFLSEDAIERIVQEIAKGPLNEEGKLDPDENYAARFRAKQIEPFRPVLKDPDLFLIRTPEGRRVVFHPDNYKAFQMSGEAHTIEQRSPVPAEKLATMPDAELWELLNDWAPDPNRRPEKWWIEEGIDGLANAFAEAVELDRERFNGSSRWWLNLRRPAFYWRILDRAFAGDKVGEPDPETWTMWLGLCQFVMAQDPIERPNQEGVSDDTSASHPTWKYARWSAARFIERALQQKQGPPVHYADQIATLLKHLALDDDPKLEQIEKSWSSSSFDWLSKGINSPTGTAIEGLLLFAVWHRKHARDAAPTTWITDVLLEQLQKGNQSPAVFAVLGSQLGLLAHLFPEWCRQHQDAIFPFNSRPLHAEAALVSHLSYNNPNGIIISTFPDLMDRALNIVDLTDQQGRRADSRRELPVRLGYHLAYYYWNALPDPKISDGRVQQFFDSAPPSVRGRLISQIGRVFAKATNDGSGLIERAQKLWQRRAELIITCVKEDSSSITSFAPELASFVHWIKDECFDAQWRLSRLNEALELLEKAPDALDLPKTLERLSEDQSHLRSVMRSVQLLTQKFSDPFRWSVRKDAFKETIKRGLESEEINIREMANAARDNLLRQGLFDYHYI
jgi:hypothetical protein